MSPAQGPGWLAGIAARWVRGANAEFVLADLADDYVRSRAAGNVIGASFRYLRLAWASRRAMVGNPSPRNVAAALAADSRFAARGLRKNPGFAAVAVLTLALGIGANAAIFSVVHGILLAPLPYPEPDRVVNVWQVFRDWQASENAYFRERAERFPVSWPTYLEWQARSRSLASIAVYGEYPSIVDGIDAAEWVNVVSTTSSFVDVVGVEPALGRWFSEAEDQVGGEKVAVISHRYWQKLGGDESVLGASFRLHGDPFTIIGVMPAGFYFPDRTHDIWYPVPDGRRNDRFGSQSMAAIARLAPGIGLAEARREMDTIAEQIIADRPDAIDAGVRLIGRVEEVTGATASTLQLLAAAVGLVLLVAAANVAGLLLVRATSRHQELAIRAALGARRARLVAQLMVEGAVLAGLGGLVGLGAVAATLSWLRASLPSDTPRLADVAMNWQVAAFVAGVSALVALVFGLISAAHLRRSDPSDGLRASARLVTGSRGRAMLVVGEIAVSVVLLAAAALLGGSYMRLASIDSGIQSDGLLSLHVAAPIDTWHDSPAELRTFYTETSRRLRSLPGVAGAAAVSSLPFSGSQSSGSFGFIENATNPEDAGWSVEQNVSGSYFDVMGIPLVAGRALADDYEGSAELVVNATFAALHFPGRTPLGEVIWDNDRPHTIVGVARDIRHGQLTEEIEPKRYRLFNRDTGASFAFAIRVSGDPAAVAAAAADQLPEVVPGTTVSEIATMTDLLARTTALPRFRTLLLAALAGLAILLAAVGLYGVVAFAVAARRREFGLRMTLGAGGAQVARLVLLDGLRLTLPGITLGLGASLIATSWLSSYLYEIEPRDPLILGLVALAVTALALTAMALPAWRALRVDPMVALRGE
jgi:predicted permease